MPTILSGQRIARSFVSPTGAANEVTRLLDFQLAADEGIRIFGVLGYGHLIDPSPAPSDTVPIAAVGYQSLNQETGETEDLPMEAGDDADDIDTEFMYVQHYTYNAIVGNTATFGAGVHEKVTPTGLFVPPEPMDSARNITHKAETISASTLLNCGVLIYFKYMRFSNSELGVMLARR